MGLMDSTRRRKTPATQVLHSSPTDDLGVNGSAYRLEFRDVFFCAKFKDTRPNARLQQSRARSGRVYLHSGAALRERVFPSWKMWES